MRTGYNYPQMMDNTDSLLAGMYLYIGGEPLL